MDTPRRGRPDRKPLRSKSGESASFKLPKATNPDALSWPMRLNKYVAASGICARRAAGDLVKLGKVKVNGVVEPNPAVLVSQTDVIEYEGKVVRPTEKFVYILLNKPKNYLCTSSDDRGRHSVLELIRDVGKERLYSVGRLDRNTTGLLILTNDGDLTQRLAHPKNQVSKTYLIELERNVTEKDMQRISEGLELEDGKAQVDGVAWLDPEKRNQVWIELHSGKNRIVRRIFETLGYEVIRLDRIGYAGLTKKDLPRGRYRHLTDREVIMLRHFTGRSKGLDMGEQKKESDPN
jgi:23S rRNA pseudouridine2605 synthase